MAKFFAELILGVMIALWLAATANAYSLLGSQMTLLALEPVAGATASYDDKKRKTVISELAETRCLALALYHEARGEPVIGQYAVVATILNRVRSSAYPKSVCGVVFQNMHLKHRCQFSFACDDKSDWPDNSIGFQRIENFSSSVLNANFARQAKFLGPDFAATAENMTHYHRHDVQPVWSSKLQELSVLGQHVFLKSERVTKRYKY